MLIQLLIILLCASTAVFADDRSQEVAKALTLVQEKVADAKTWEGRNSDYPYIALLNEYETKLNPDWSYVETYHVRVKIQQESAKELGEWPIYYNKSREEIVDLQAFVETPEGKKIKATTIQDLEAYDNSPMYSDMKVKVVTLPQVNIGTVIDVSVKTKVSRKEISDQFWDEIPYPVIPTKFARHTYIFPEAMKIQFKSYKDDHKPVIQKKDGIVRYSYVFEETAYTEEEEMMPPIDEIRGGVYLSSISDWKMIADWYRDLVLKNTVNQGEIVAKTEELIKDKTTQKDRARAILEFIQDNFRYVVMSFGDHTVEPHKSSDVFVNRYGDCKDLGLLARQMFMIAGIDSNIVLMSGEFTGNPQNGLPSPSMFEHLILEAKLDGQTFYIDPQTKGFDFGQLPTGYDNAYVFVIGRDGFRFDRLPIEGDELRSIISQSEVALKPDGSAIFNVHVKLPLEASQAFRMQWQNTTEDNKSKFFDSLEANFAQGGNMISHQVKGLDDRYGSIEFDLKYESPTAYPVVNDMILLKEADQSDVPEFSAARRKYPIYLPTNSSIQNTNIYHIPEGYKVDFLPTDFKLGIDFAEISADYNVKGDTVSVHTLYRMKRASVPAARYKEVKNFRNELYKKNDQYVVLKLKSQTNPQAKDWIKQQ